jgi:hypothetical protein
MTFTIKRQPKKSIHKSMQFAVFFDDPYTPDEVYPNAINLQTNVTPYQLENCELQLNFELQVIARAQELSAKNLVHPAPIKRECWFNVNFGHQFRGEDVLKLNATEMSMNLSPEQIAECEAAVKHHLKTVELAKLLSARGNVLVEVA